jgi:DNA-binding XRE family transcriptional regulator
MFTGAQCRAARGLVDWTRDELAKAAKVSPETIKNIEHGVFRPQEETAMKIQRTFEMEGVEFTDDEGVRFRKDSVMRFEGVEGFKRFMDDVYKAAIDPAAAVGGEKPICVGNVDDRLFVKHLGDYMDLHAKRMDALKNVKVRALIPENDIFVIQNCNYPEYRWSPSQSFGSVPFYVYGDKFAVLLLEENKAQNIQIIVITSAPVAKAYRDQFEFLWKNSKSMKKATRTPG